MTENITLELTPKLTEDILDYANELAKMFGIQGYGPNAALWHLKTKIEEGKVVLEQIQLEEKAKIEAKAAKTSYKVVNCPVENSATHHDCWILDKKTKTVYYSPFGHHYQLIAYLMNNHPGVIDGTWHKSDSAAPTIRTGDVKHGNPRTAKENNVTHKGLRKVLIKAYYDARHQEIPPHMV